MGEVGAGQGKKTSKPKDGGKEASGFNFAGSTGSKFGTAFSTQPIQVTAIIVSNAKLCFYSPTLGVSEGSKQQPGRGCQVLLSQLYKPGEKSPRRRDWFPGSRSSTRCQLKGRRECGRESQKWEEMRSWFSTGTKTINFAK